ncbi:hypothetical protein BDW72DRAFT_66450 [Aspergillus terricola var. indicus]
MSLGVLSLLVPPRYSVYFHQRNARFSIHADNVRINKPHIPVTDSLKILSCSLAVISFFFLQHIDPRTRSINCGVFIHRLLW